MKYTRLVVVSIAIFAAIAAVSIAAQEWNSGIRWLVPKVVDPGPVGGPPSDAIVLFNGTDMSAWKGGEKWKVNEGVAIANGGSISTKQLFGSCQLHVEFASPEEVKGKGQGRGNSGLYFMGEYEIQILDSYQNETYPDGQAASVYKQSPPLVNASRRPGEWQMLDVIFTAPKFMDDGSLESPAYFTVLHNGVLVQNHFELIGDTAWHKPPEYRKHAEKAPLHIQYHGNPVRFRNIWIRPLDDCPRVAQ